MFDGDGRFSFQIISADGSKTVSSNPGNPVGQAVDGGAQVVQRADDLTNNGRECAESSGACKFKGNGLFTRILLHLMAKPRILVAVLARAARAGNSRNGIWSETTLKRRASGTSFNLLTLYSTLVLVCFL
jgi:hypothetical protein